MSDILPRFDVDFEVKGLTGRQRAFLTDVRAAGEAALKGMCETARRELGLGPDEAIPDWASVIIRDQLRGAFGDCLKDQAAIRAEWEV